jgi:hypothetical protein
MAKKNSNPYSEFPKTSELVDRLLSTFPQYKNYTKDQFFSMLDKIAKAETQDSNIRQLEGGPGRGYYQMELTSAPYAYKRAININTSLKERNQPTIELPPYNQDFTKLSKDDQAFYVLSNMVGAAGAKREQGNPNAYLDPNRPKEMWINYHWAGKEKDKADRIKHWESVHGKSPKVIDKKVSKPVAKFQPNEIGIPIFTTKGDFIWDNTPAQIETALYGVGPTVQKANAVNQAAAVGTPLFDKGGLIKRKDGSYSRNGGWLDAYNDGGETIGPTIEKAKELPKQFTPPFSPEDAKLLQEKFKPVPSESTNPNILKYAIDAGGMFFYPLSLVGAGWDLINKDYVGAVAGAVPGAVVVAVPGAVSAAVPVNLAGLALARVAGA